MSRKDFTIIALRLMAIYLALSGLSSLLPTLGLAISTFFQNFDSNSQLMTIIGSSYGILYLIACGFLWPLAPKIAAFIEKDLQPEENEKLELNYTSCLTIGLTLLGFIVLSGAIPTLVKVVTAVLLPSFDTNYAKVLSRINGDKITIIPWSEILHLIVELFIGVWFVFGSSGIITFLKKVRYAGRNHITNQST